MEYSNAFIMIKSLILTRNDIKTITFGNGCFILEHYDGKPGEKFHYTGDDPSETELDELVTLLNECIIKCTNPDDEISEDNC